MDRSWRKIVECVLIRWSVVTWAVQPRTRCIASTSTFKLNPHISLLTLLQNQIMEITDESDLETLSSGPTYSNKPNNSIPAPPEDNFYSPQNRPFYAKSPYKPLDPTQQQIRLLKFLPSNDDEVLSFALLDNRPLESVRSRYTALSYCAGDPRKTKAIYVNGARFNAFANL